MGMVGSLGAGATAVDKVLGNAYQIVKHVHDNLASITTVAALTENITLLAENLDAAAEALLSGHAAIIMAGVANFRSNYADGVLDFPVGAYFTSAESGALRLYKRVVGAPGYVDQGDVVAPISRTLLASVGGAALVGTAEADINVQEALDARPKASVLASDNGAQMVGMPGDANVYEELLARPTADALSDEDGATLVGTTVAGGGTVEQVLARLIPVTTTEAALLSVLSTVNANGKFFGRLAYNEDDDRIYIARGDAANSTWASADAMNVIIPV